MKKIIPVLLSSVLSLGISTNLMATDAYKTLVDDKGNISLPKNYKTTWTFLGSYFVKNTPDESEAETAEASYDVHTVYSQPETVAHYRKNNEFPDGAILVKEVNGTNKESLTTGEARYKDIDTAKVIFVMVKDGQNRFPENAAWGEGWGWALFEAGKTKSQTTNWKGEGFNNCYGCHLPVKQQDWVYTQGYEGVLTK